MSEPSAPASSAPNAATVPMGDLKKGISGDAGTPQHITVPDHASGMDDDDFYTWPTLGGHPNMLPPEYLDRIRQNRDALPDLPNIGKTQKGYTYGGKSVEPDPLLDANDEKQYPSPKARERLVGILKRLPIEVGGEGGTSSAMTGDSARFTWGHGLTRTYLANAFSRFLAASPSAKMAFLDHGIAMEDKEWKIVDLSTGGYKTGPAALELLDGKEPADVKRKFISIFGTLTERDLQAAENGQWKAWKDFLYAAQVKPPADVVESEAWTPEAVCYVVHCAGWGKFAGWDRFKKTGGDLRKILRLEADYTFNRPAAGHMLVKHTDKTSGGSEVYPSTTMIFNMGHGIMYKNIALDPIQDPASVTNGDAVFEIHPAHRSKVGGAAYARLSNVPAQYSAQGDAESEYAKWVADNQGLSMDRLLKACEARGYAKLLKTRDWYARVDGNGAPVNEKYGLRVRVAMDAVLHKGEGAPGAWILSDADRAGINANQCTDQYILLKSKIGIA